MTYKGAVHSDLICVVFGLFGVTHGDRNAGCGGQETVVGRSLRLSTRPANREDGDWRTLNLRVAHQAGRQLKWPDMPVAFDLDDAIKIRARSRRST